MIIFCTIELPSCVFLCVLEANLFTHFSSPINVLYISFSYSPYI